MTNDSQPPLGTLISDNVGRGRGRKLSRTAIAKAAGCSRTQLWRLETGRTRGDSAAARDVRRFLGKPDLLRRELMAAVDACVGSGGARAEKVLQVLHLLGELGALPDGDGQGPNFAVDALQKS